MDHPPFFSTAPDGIPLSMHDLTPPFLSNKEIKNMTPQQVTADSLQWAMEGELSDHLTGARRNNLHQRNFKENPNAKQTRWCEALIVFLPWLQRQATEWHSIEVQSTRGPPEMMKFLLLTIHVTSLCSSWWGTEGWVQGKGGQKGHTKSEVYHCRRSEPTLPQKFLQGPWFAQSLSHNLIRAKEIAKVAFERHSMVRSWRPWAWQLAAYMRPRSTDGRQLAQVPGCQLD